MPARILLTGPPGCGKTTVILRTLELLSRPVAGFYTEELRAAGGRRIGFDVVALGGRRGPLARAGEPGPRVGRYGVDRASFETIGVRALEAGLREESALLVVDEIGKMELSSPRFVALLPRVFEGPNPVLGAILAGPHPVAHRYRRGPAVSVVEVTASNRATLPAELAARLSGSVR